MVGTSNVCECSSRSSARAGAGAILTEKRSWSGRSSEPPPVSPKRCRKPSRVTTPRAEAQERSTAR
eukprot:scaffold19865_cov120-Isochrysis_galbana.AAC.1